MTSRLVAFDPPTDSDRTRAIGPLHNLPKPLQAAFRENRESKAFTPKQEPAPGDWLAQHKERGQTYEQFIRSRPNIPNSLRKTIYILPLGEFDPKTAPDLDTLHTCMEAYFDPIAVKFLPVVPDAKVPAKSRVHLGNKQWKTGDILDWMRPRLPKDAYAMLAVTMTDLYPGDSWNFVFGQATFKERVGLFSFARYHPSFYGRGADENTTALVLTRAAKVLTHETGHMFGISHCVHFECNMAGSNHLRETDASPSHLCPVCLRKLYSSLKFDPLERYRKLHKFYSKEELEKEAAWTAARIEMLENSR